MCVLSFLILKFVVVVRNLFFSQKLSGLYTSFIRFTSSFLMCVCTHCNKVILTKNVIYLILSSLITVKTERTAAEFILSNTPYTKIVFQNSFYIQNFNTQEKVCRHRLFLWLPFNSTTCILLFFCYSMYKNNLKMSNITDLMFMLLVY